MFSEKRKMLLGGLREPGAWNRGSPGTVHQGELPTALQHPPSSLSLSLELRLGLIIALGRVCGVGVGWG